MSVSSGQRRLWLARANHTTMLKGDALSILAISWSAAALS